MQSNLMKDLETNKGRDKVIRTNLIGLDFIRYNMKMSNMIMITFVYITLKKEIIF